LASSSHMSLGSPCIGAGSSSYTSGVDIDGEPWRNPPCIGADQYVPGSVTGALTMTISTSYTNVAAGFAVDFVTQNQGSISASVLDFGDGTVVSNRVQLNHAWRVPGMYAVRLTGYNDQLSERGQYDRDGASEPAGLLRGGRECRPQYPYTNWQTAATSIKLRLTQGQRGSFGIGIEWGFMRVAGWRFMGR